MKEDYVYSKLEQPLEIGWEIACLYLESKMLYYFLCFFDTLHLPMYWYFTSGELDAGRDNLAVAREILALRVQQARMHGYDNYAQYATADTMAGSPAKVMDLLEVSQLVTLKVKLS